jgi:hypothetical protein
MPKISPRKRRTSLILISTLAAVFMAGALYFLVTGGPRPQSAIIAENPGWEKGSVLHPEPPVPVPEMSAVPHQEANDQVPVRRLAAAPAPVQDPCWETYDRISGFFSYLDKRNYVNLYELQGGSELHFAELFAKLYASPPVVVRETDSLLTLLRNTTHIYRVLGRSNVFLLKDIMEEESATIETTMAEFYRWSTVASECRAKENGISLPLENLYDYASYFLTTMGGQSYLFRRTPRIRTLTKYYSVLILDRANEQGLNKHGIDIRPVLDSLIGEMEAIQSLKAQDEYLGLLQNLKLKYLAQYGRR